MANSKTTTKRTSRKKADIEDPIQTESVEKISEVIETEARTEDLNEPEVAKVLGKNQFELDGQVYEIKALKFIIGNRTYTRDSVLKSKAEQKLLVNAVFFEKGKALPIHQVRSSVIKAIF